LKPEPSELETESAIIGFFNIIHRPITFLIKNNVPVTEPSLHPQVKGY
jgi:hypothetical protein